MVAYDERGFPELDLSMLLEPGVKFCVRCTEKDDAKNFVSAIIEQYPDVARPWTLEDHKLRDFVHGKHLDFYPDLNGAENWEMLSWDDGDYAENNGYLIIDFNELPMVGVVEDLGIFVPADELLDELLT